MSEKVEKVANKLDNLHAEFVKRGGKVDPKKYKEAAAAWSKAHSARMMAEKALEDARRNEEIAAVGVIQVRGKGRLRIGETVYVSSCTKSNTVFLRPEGGGDVYEG